MAASKMMILQPLPPRPPQGGSLTIENGAYGPLRQFLTEYLVAWAFASRGDDALLCVAATRCPASTPARSTPMSSHSSR